MAKRKYLPFWYLQILLFTWKDQGNIKGPGIYCGGHLTVTYGGELYLRIFLRSCPPSNFVVLELPFLHGLQSRTHHMLSHGKSRRNDNMCRSRRMIWPTHLHKWQSIWPLPHSVITGVKKRPNSPLKFLGKDRFMGLCLHAQVKQDVT